MIESLWTLIVARSEDGAVVRRDVNASGYFIDVDRDLPIGLYTVTVVGVWNGEPYGHTSAMEICA